MLTAKAREIFITEANIQPIPCPVTICGDVHGNFTICWNCSELEVTFPIPIISLWVTTLIAVITLLVSFQLHKPLD